MRFLALFLVVVAAAASPILAPAQSTGPPSAPLPSPSLPGSLTSEQLYKVGEKAYAAHDYESALRWWRAGLADATARERKKPVEWLAQRDAAIFLTYISVANHALGRYSEALAANRQALTIDRALGNREGEASTLASIGLMSMLIGRYPEALDSYRQARAIFHEIKRRGGEASALSNIGEVEEILGRYAEALSAQQDSLAIYREVHDRPGESQALTNIGIIYDDFGSYDDALAVLQQALAINRQIPDRLGEAGALINLGHLHRNRGFYADALSEHQKGLAIAREIRDGPSEAAALENIGLDDRSLGLYADGLEAFQRALAIHRGDYDPIGEATALFYIGVLEADLGRFAESQRSASQSVALLKPLGNADAWRPLQTVAFAEYKLGADDDAQKHYDEALAQIETLRGGVADNRSRSSFFGNTLFVYDQYTSYLLELNQRYPGRGYDRKALDIFERRAARGALEEIAASAAQHFVNIPSDVVADDNATAAAVSRAQSAYMEASLGSNPDRTTSAKAALVTLQQQQTALTAQIKERYPQYYDLRHPQPISVEVLQRDVLQPGEILLVYDLLPSQSALWLVTRDRFQLITLPSDQLRLKIFALHKHVETIEANGSTGTIGIAEGQDMPGFARDSYALFRALVPKDVEQQLTGAKSVVIVPSGALFALPFAALVVQDPSATPGPPHYLIQDLAISYVPSASLLGVVRRSYTARTAAPNTLLAFAAPNFGPRSSPAPIVRTRDGTPRSFTDLQTDAFRSVLRPGVYPTMPGAFPPLDGARLEAEGVRLALDASTDSVITSDAASRQRVMSMNQAGQLKNFRYLLFATHAVLPDKIKGLTQPAIVLAHPERGNGFLTMADVFGLSLNADLVALSACDTGVVSNPSGEGISGLTRAFLYAGTPAIAVTLWKVDDDAAPQIMPHFFGAMRAGARSAQALREAQLSMVANKDPRLHHPFAWAPFVIFGDGNLANAPHLLPQKR
jgi:CHAT domain-containing protein/tetratricopeptide (TPR) repeat protein